MCDGNVTLQCHGAMELRTTHRNVSMTAGGVDEECSHMHIRRAISGTIPIVHLRPMGRSSSGNPRELVPLGPRASASNQSG